MGFNCDGRIAAGLIGVIAAICVMADVERAVALSNLRDSCARWEMRATPAEIDVLRADPTVILNIGPDDNWRLEQRLAKDITTEPALLDGMLQLLPTASPPQKRAIGAGLADAEMTCQSVAPETAAAIFDFVRGLGDREVSAGYASVREPARKGQLQKGAVAAPVSGLNALTIGNGSTQLSDPFAAPAMPE
jgi:hypothetical protein